MIEQLRVAVDVGCERHRVAVGLADGSILDEFDVTHNAEGVRNFFDRVSRHEVALGLPVAVAMEGYNGYARPIDQQVMARGWQLFNVNNLKLARFKEIFPAPAKTDAIDARRILQLFNLKDRAARKALEQIRPVPLPEAQLKALTRRRKQLVHDRARISMRMQAELHAVCPGLLGITKQASNVWFLSLLACRDDLTKLASLRLSTLLELRGVGRVYAGAVRRWQQDAMFSDTVAWTGPMIVEDARMIIGLNAQIKALDNALLPLIEESPMAGHIISIPGFGTTCSAELAGEIGTVERFAGESSLALYLGMAPLDNSSGEHHGSKAPRQVNVRAKAAMMIAVKKHMDNVPESRAFYDRKRRQGKGHNQAIRALGRHLVRVIYSMLTGGHDYAIRC
jgi:transposase